MQDAGFVVRPPDGWCNDSDNVSEVVLGPGDVMYHNAGVWHSVETLDDALSVCLVRCASVRLWMAPGVWDSRFARCRVERWLFYSLEKCSIDPESHDVLSSQINISLVGLRWADAATSAIKHLL